MSTFIEFLVNLTVWRVQQPVKYNNLYFMAWVQQPVKGFTKLQLEVVQADPGYGPIW